MRSFVFSVALLWVAGTAFAASDPCASKKSRLPAPAGVVASSIADNPATLDDEAALLVEWEPVSGATRYAVEVLASYASCGRTTRFNLTVYAPESSLSIALAELDACADPECAEFLEAQSAAVRVKALNPPQAKDKLAQCNPFSPSSVVDFCGDLVDGDCDGSIDESCDADGDGFLPGDPPSGDCNDADPAVHPGAADWSCGGTGDGVDNDCDGAIDEDSCPLSLEKRTNGQDIAAPPGPTIRAGTTVYWTYIVTNDLPDGSLTGITVTDDQGVTVSCPKTALSAGETMTCTGSGPALRRQYTNTGTVVATLPSGASVSASDSSYYYGVDAEVSVETLTNGVDADTPPGPTLLAGSAVLWTYVATNTGECTLTSVSVTDNRGVAVTCPKTNLTPGESMTCTASGTARAGQYANIGTVTGTCAWAGPITASDPSHYSGYSPGIMIETLVNGDEADVPPGPSISAGSTLQWTYAVTNIGDTAITGVSVTAETGPVVNCPKTTLDPGESMTCTASGIAIAGQFCNLGTAQGTALDVNVTHQDAACYFGSAP
jgi:hypothetical protein